VTIDETTETKGIGEYAEVNGINLYFETHGAGRPMLLLHGGLGSGEMFGPTLPTLAERHQVIAVDLQGHGRTADVDRPLDVRLMADDIGALVDHLGLDKPDLVGYSLGGWVALHTAAKYPAKVGRLVAASANIRPDAIYPEMRAQQGQVNAAAAEFMTDTPMYQLYQRVAPRREDFPRLLDKIGEAMAKDFDFTEEVRGLQVPTLIVAADAGMAPRATMSRSSSCSTAAFATAAGWVRAGPRAVTRSRSCPASPTTTWPPPRCSRRSPSPSSTSSRAERFQVDLSSL
jgi:pimeloyl-ACP methyl ester carboxylesterase